MIDLDLLEEFKARLADRYTAEELVEMLRLSEWDILEAFHDKIADLMDEEQEEDDDNED